MSQPSLTEIREKVQIALDTRALGRKLRAGKPIAFQPHRRPGTAAPPASAGGPK